MNEYSIAGAFIVGWMVFMIVDTYQRGRRRHERHLERMAMIERGLTPPPEPPSGVLADVFEGMHDREKVRSPNHVKIVSRNVGIILLCLGLGIGLLLLTTGAGRGRILGVGGLLVFLSAAFF